MKVVFCFCLVAASILMGVNSVAAYEGDPIQLRVALYPYVPLRRALFFELEQAFERDNPGVNIELVESSELLWDYYSGGLQKVEADIFEIDTILLSDMVRAGKVAPLSLPEMGFFDSAIAAVTREGVAYAVPHWVCGNFLFYRKRDTEVADAKSWSSLLEILRERGDVLLVDFKGRSTLGEWYFSLLSMKLGIAQAQSTLMSSKAFDSSVFSVLKESLERCPAGFCRSENLHDRAGYYARMFIRGKASVYVGYSESLHYGLQNGLEDCTPISGCLKEADIGIRKLPVMAEAKNEEGVGWVDGLAISSTLSKPKKDIALKFIEFLVSDQAYRLILEPEWSEAPRYLIPARRLRIKGAPLYTDFFEAYDGRKTGTAAGLNDRLREFGSKLDCALPLERTDSAAHCLPQ
jgi:thiamine pyridinylase